MAKYMMNCPVCSMELSVEANDEDEAMMQMKEAAKSHMMEAHKDAPMAEDAELEKMIKEGWRMEE
jgi:hypothetical protein